MEYKRHIEDLLKKEYLKYHNNCGIQVGDSVKIISKAEDYGYGWGFPWVPPMDQYVGTIVKIDEDCQELGFTVTHPEGHYYYPAFCLEKATVVIDNNLENEVWHLYDESDGFQGPIKNYLSFLYVRRQIKELGLKGYYIKNGHLRFDIGADGTLEADMADVTSSSFTGYPFLLIDSLLDELTEF